MSDADPRAMSPTEVPLGPSASKRIPRAPVVTLGVLATVLAGGWASAGHGSGWGFGSNDKEPQYVTSSQDAAAQMSGNYLAGIVPAANALGQSSSTTHHGAATAAQQQAQSGQHGHAAAGPEASAGVGPLPIISDDTTRPGEPFVPADAATAPPAAPISQKHGDDTGTSELKGPVWNGPGSAPDPASTPGASREDEEQKRGAQMHREMQDLRKDMFLDALGAPMRVKWSTNLNRQAPGRGDSTASAAQKLALADRKLAQIDAMPPAGSYMDKLRALQQSNLLAGAASPGSEPASRNRAPSAYDKFDGTADRWKLDTKVEDPEPYQIRAGWIIPAILDSFINSDLPGPIRATVTIDVRDTPTGQHVLIPHGSRLLGTYSADVAFGQDRLLVAWQRIVFPDGKALDIGSMATSDGSGVGLADQVNNHYFQLFTSALLMSGVSSGVAVSQDAFAQQDKVTMGGTMAQQLGQQLGQLSEEMIRRNLQVAPTIEIRAGKLFAVEVQKDLVFPGPYGAFDYLTAAGKNYGVN